MDWLLDWWEFPTISPWSMKLSAFGASWTLFRKRLLLDLIHPWKLTWHWKIPIFNRKYIFKWWVFHCHVSFRGGRFVQTNGVSKRNSFVQPMLIDFVNLNGIHQNIYSSWWFEPIMKNMLVKLDHFRTFRGDNILLLKPPPSIYITHGMHATIVYLPTFELIFDGFFI